MAKGALPLHHPLSYTVQGAQGFKQGDIYVYI